METWENLGGTWIGGPAVVAGPAGTSYVFVVGADHRLYAGRTSPAHSIEWENLGGLMSTAPNVVAGGGRMDVFAVSPDASVCHRAHFHGKWSPWRPLGCIVGGAPLTVPHGARPDQDRLDLVVLNSALSVQHRRLENESWSAWTTVAEESFGEPAILYRGPQNLDLVARGADGRLHHAAQVRGEWSSPRPAGPDRTVVGPALIGSPDGVDLYYVGLDRMLYLRQWDGKWGESVCLEGTITERPTVVGRPDGGVDIFVVGEDRAIWHRSSTAAVTTWWRSLGGQAYSGIGVTGSSDRLDLFVLGRDSAVWRRSFLR